MRVSVAIAFVAVAASPLAAQTAIPPKAEQITAAASRRTNRRVSLRSAFK